jgi:hypothetical protein
VPQAILLILATPAHIAIQRRPSVCRSVCLSVKQARFVAMGAIDPLLCEEVPVGQVT